MIHTGMVSWDCRTDLWASFLFLAELAADDDLGQHPPVNVWGHETERLSEPVDQRKIVLDDGGLVPGIKRLELWQQLETRS